MAQISRDPADLVRQMMGPHHQYPDGAMLFLGTLFAPVKDRDRVGRRLHPQAGRHRAHHQRHSSAHWSTACSTPTPVRRGLLAAPI